MSLKHPDYVPQPYVAWVDMYMVGELSMSLTRDSRGRPLRLLSFEHNIDLKRISTWSITLFDPNWDEVLRIVKGLNSLANVGEGNSIQPLVEFEYYYYGSGGLDEPKRSPRYRGFIMSIAPDIRPEGITLTLEGYGSEFSLMLTEKCGSYFMEGRVLTREEIIRDIINGYPNWKIVYFEPIEELQTTTDYRKTGGQVVPPIRENESDMSYLIRLLQGCKSKLNGTSGYIIKTTDNKAGGKDVIIGTTNTLEKMQLNKEKLSGELGYGSVRSFFFMFGNPMSEVISWSPEINSSVYAMINWAGNIAANGIALFDQSTGKVSIQESGTKEKTIAHLKTTAVNVTNPHLSGKVLVKPSYNADERNRDVLEKFYKQWSTVMLNAEMEIVGDPTLQTIQVIEVFVVLGNGSLHESSGYWTIYRISHRISGGSFVSSLSLHRGTELVGTDATGNPPP